MQLSESAVAEILYIAEKLLESGNHHKSLAREEATHTTTVIYK